MKICPKCSKEHELQGRFCSRSCANSRIWSIEDRKKKSEAAKNSEKVMGLVKELSAKHPRGKSLRKWKIVKCSGCGNEFSIRNSKSKVPYCGNPCRAPRGGLRKNSGVGKSGWYKGMFLNSTYELAYVMYHLDHGIQIERCDKYFLYEDLDGKTRKYFPDFIVDGRIIEIKGYKSQVDKIKASTCDAILLYKDDLSDIFSYVTEKYGKIENLYSHYGQ